jgi:hypothetical protein
MESSMKKRFSITYGNGIGGIFNDRLYEDYKNR